MTLIVEDGTGVADADSYNSTAEFIAYAALYGITVASDVAEVPLRKGMDNLEYKEYKGCKKYTTNDLQFPRDNMCVNGTVISSDTSLAKIKKVHNEMSLSIFNGFDPQAIKQQAVKSKTLGPLSITYDNTINAYPDNPKLDALLKPLLKYGSAGIAFRVVSDLDGQVPYPGNTSGEYNDTGY